eukprot:1104032-Pyramimonas_sp.AAC.1
MTQPPHREGTSRGPRKRCGDRPPFRNRAQRNCPRKPVGRWTAPTRRAPSVGCGTRSWRAAARARWGAGRRRARA